jgi:predicted SprT family Zn-dependent metalloprotease
MSKQCVANLAVRYRKQLASWAKLWNLPGLDGRIDVVFGSRLRMKLGSCDPRRGLIRLNTVFKNRARIEVLEALCHEAAHIAVFEAFGGHCRPHGEEWRRLVLAAGFEPKVALELRGEPHPPRLLHPKQTLYEHRCPICQVIRVATRPVSRWRCAACADAGLDGTMVITKRSQKGRMTS